MNVSTLTRDIQMQYAEEGHVDTRKYLASSHATIDAALGKLAIDPDIDVRCILARNLNCPWDILEGMLRHDTNPAVGEAVVQNPTLPNFVISDIVARASDAHLSDTAWLLLLQNPNCSEEDAQTIRSFFNQ